MFPIVGENIKGIRVERGTETDLVIFRSGTGTASIRSGEWAADASALTVTNNGAKLKTLAAQNARTVTKGGQLMFSAETPAGVAAAYSNEQIDAVVSSTSKTGIVLFVGSRPTEVQLGGDKLTANAFSFDPRAGTITLSVPAGQPQLRISLK